LAAIAMSHTAKNPVPPPIAAPILRAQSPAVENV